MLEFWLTGIKEDSGAAVGEGHQAPRRGPAHDPLGLTPAPGADAGFQEMTAVQLDILGVSRGLHNF